MENYQAKSNLHLQEFGTTISKGSIITLDGNKLTCGPLEGEVGNSFRIFVRSGALIKVDEETARQAQNTSGKVTYRTRPAEEKMPLVNADINRIEIKNSGTKRVASSTTAEEGNEEENGPVVRGMKVNVHETIDIGTKVKDIPTTSKGIETKKNANATTPRNRVKERTEDMETLKKKAQERKAARLKELEEMEAKETKKIAPKAELPKEPKDEKIELDLPEEIPTEPVEAPAVEPTVVDVEPKEGDENATVAQAEETKIKLPPATKGVIVSKSRESETATQVKSIKIK